MSLAHRSVTAATWEFGSVVAQACIQFAVMVVLARLIPPEDFGLYAIASMAIGMVLIFAEVGVGPAVVQRKEITLQYINSAFTLSLALGALGAALCWLASPLIASFFGQSDVTNLLRAASVTLIISGYVVVHTALLERELRFRKLAIVNVTSYAIGFGLIGIIMALMGMGVWAIVAATISQNLVRALMLRAMSKWTVRIALCRRDASDIVRFGGGVSIARVFTFVASQIDNVVVGRLIGAAALGLYQMAFTIIDMPRRFLGSVIDRVMFAAMSRVQEDTARLRTGYLQSIELANVLLLTVTVFLIITAPEIVRGILGERWSDVILPLQILLTQVPLRASIRMADQVGGAVGRVYYVATTKILYAAMVGIAAVLGIKWGLTGVATAVTVATIANWLIMVRFALQVVKASVREYLGAWIPGLRVSLVVTLAALLGAEIMRRSFESEILRLVGVVAITMLAVLVLVSIYPRVIGDTGLWLILDLGRRMPSFSGFFAWLEKRVSSDGRPKVGAAGSNIR